MNLGTKFSNFKENIHFNQSDPGKTPEIQDSQLFIKSALFQLRNSRNQPNSKIPYGNTSN